MDNLNLLFKKLKKYKIKKIKDLNIKEKKVKNINIIETKFISNEIKKYIKKKIENKNCDKNETCNNCYIIIYNYNNIIIKLKYYSKKNLKKKLIKEILKRIIFMMDITDVYIDLNIEIYNTPYKKELPCYNCLKKITANNINSGLNYGNNIIIFRNEELLKVLIHEVIHALDIDIKDEDYNKKKKLLTKLNIKELLVNESYVETWANIINIYLVLYNKKRKNISLFDYKEYFNNELLFNLKQCCKILLYFNTYTIKDLSKTKLNDKSNVFSYFILKTYNLYYINNFLKKFMDKKNIIVKKYDFSDYINYLLKIIKTDIFHKKIKELQKNKYNLSMKMTI